MKTYTGTYHNGEILFSRVPAHELWDALPTGSRISGKPFKRKKGENPNYAVYDVPIGRKLIVEEDVVESQTRMDL